MKKTMRPSIALTLLLAIQAADAADVAIDWQQPERYSDIRPVHQSAARFQERLFRVFRETLEHLAQRLPADQHLKITFEDIDLAGDLRTGSFGQVRVVRDTSPARLRFRWELLDAAGRRLAGGEERLTGSRVSAGTLARPGRDPFGIEKALLERWFSRTFAEAGR